METRLEQQIAFIVEMDRLKTIFRQSLVTADKRRENDAEHSWHLALMVLVLAEHANTKDMDLLKILRMVIIHDLVEIDAGDTFIYDIEARKTQAERERRAADRIFNLVPSDQAEILRSAWDEFEARETAEARFASAVDRLQPILQNFHSGGATWKQNGIRRAQVVERNQHIREGSEDLWEYAQTIISAAVEKGYLQP